MELADYHTYLAGRFAGGRDYSRGRDYNPPGDKSWQDAGYADGWTAEQETEYWPGAGE